MRSNKGVSTVLVALALIAIIVACIVFVYISLKPAPLEVAEPYYGTLSLTIGELSKFDRSTVSTTTPTYEVFHTGGKSLDDMAESDFTGPTSGSLPSAQDLSINPEDLGYFFLRAYGGSAHFVDVEATKSANPRVTEDRYIDVNNDNKLDVVFAVYVGDMGDPGQAQKVPLDFNVLLCADDGTNVAMSSPTDKTMGNGTQTGAIEWDLTTFAEKKGFAIARIYVKQNRTEEDLFHITEASVSYAPSGVDVTDTGPIYESGAKRWSVDLDVTDYRECVYAVLVERDIGKASKASITVSFESYFSAGTKSVVEVTLYAELIKPSNGFYTTLSDVVKVDNF